MKEMVNDCENPESGWSYAVVAIAGIAFPFPNGGRPFSDTVRKVVYITWVCRSPVETGWEETKRNNERQAPEHLDTRSFGQSGPAVVGHL